jgi:DNA-binding winged helix-turn-helix (wHTH) protein
MPELQQDRKIRFEAFEFDPGTGELLKNGQPIRLQGQPARLLALLAGRPGELITRADIQKELWPDGRFVEFEHAINTAVKKVREALDDDPENPRFVETLPKLGYRFLVTVQQNTPAGPAEFIEEKPPQNADEFSIPYPRLSWSLFLVIQLGYLAMYGAALYYMSELDTALTAAGFVPVEFTFPAVLVIAMCGIAVRLYLLTAVGWRHPAAEGRFTKLFPFLLILDAIWAACPLLATAVLGSGVALAGVAGLAYLPFAQRTLVMSIKTHSRFSRT